MRFDEYARYDALGLADLVRRREVSPKELVQTAIDGAGRVNPAINAVIEMWGEEVDETYAGRDATAPFYGVPFFIKDIGVQSAGRRSEAGSRLAQGLTAAEDSFLMRRFNRSGLITIGRTTSPELGFSPATETVLNGATRNPWNSAFSPGGSSGGAAATVASGVVPMAHANDGGGSTRIPAACCGLFGLKQTRGRVSFGPGSEEALTGLGVELCVSKSVRDSAALLDAAHGYELGDPFAVPSPQQSYLGEAASRPGRLRVAVLETSMNGAPLPPALAEGIADVAKLCGTLGHDVEMIAKAPLGSSWDEFVKALAVLWGANLASTIDQIAKATGRPISLDTLEPASLKAYEYGRGLSATDLLSAFAARNIASRAAAGFLQRYDVLLTPTLAHLPTRIGAWEHVDHDMDGAGWIARMFDIIPNTPFANFTGQPAMSVPLCWDEGTGLPIGMQFLGRWGEEGLLLRLAAQLEEARPWAHRKPGIHVAN
jgi:amidase